MHNIPGTKPLLGECSCLKIFDTINFVIFAIAKLLLLGFNRKNFKPQV